MENQENVKRLIARFLDGETTLEEERSLCGWFTAHADVPEEWKPYAAFFRDMATLSPRRMPLAEAVPPAPSLPRMADGRAKAGGGRPKTAMPRRRRRAMRRLLWASAASVVLAFGVAWGWRWHEDSLLARCYGGSYIVVNGRRIDDLSQIKDSIRLTLAEAGRIERAVDSRSIVESAEQEVLESVGDGQRGEIERLLNGEEGGQHGQ